MDSFYNGFASVCKAARTIFGRTGDMRHGTSHRKQKSITALCLALLLLASGTPVRSQQRVYFVDGYHGGIYGHYPVAWKTRFITDQLAAHPEWRIGLEIEPETWDSVRLHTPGDYARLRAAAATPRVEFVNPAYGQPYCFNIHGESIVRHFEYGMAKLREHFPDAVVQCYSSEEPCFTDCLPALLRGFGFRYAVLKCPDTCWGGYVRGHGRGVVSWVGPSGDTITALPRYVCEDFVEGSTWQTTAWNNSEEYIDACRRDGVRFPAGMCFQDAGFLQCLCCVPRDEQCHHAIRPLSTSTTC